MYPALLILMIIMIRVKIIIEPCKIGLIQKQLCLLFYIESCIIRPEKLNLALNKRQIRSRSGKNLKITGIREILKPFMIASMLLKCCNLR